MDVVGLASAGEEPPLPGVAVAESVNHFGLSLLAALERTTDGSPVFVSPLSLANALGMVALGATSGGKAQSEFLGSWQLSNETALPRFFDGLHHQTSQLTALGSDVELLDVNSVWCKSSLEDRYISAVQRTFDAEAKRLPSGPKPINDWCKAATHGMIPSIVDSIDPLTVAILVNAVYFKGNWAVKFDRGHSVRGTFTSPRLGARPCAMMKRTDRRMRYAEVDGVEIVELPYGASRGRIAATVLLPPDGGALADLVSGLGARSLAGKLRRLAPTPVELQLPRFRVEFGAHDLKPELQSAFRMFHAFDGSGEFLGMSADRAVHLSSVLHKVVVEVNEEGSEAAAVTAGIMMTRAAVVMPPPPKKVIVNRPFLFLIRDTSTGMLLFAGAVTDPALDVSGV